MKRVFSALILLALAQDMCAQATLSVTPAYAYHTAEVPHGAFLLRNEGTQPLEVIVTAEYGVIASDSAAAMTGVRLGTAGLLGDLTDRLTFFPQRLVLAPGKEQVVRYLVEGALALPRGGHITLLHFKMQERAALDAQVIPEVASAISIEYSLVVPLLMISGRGAPRLAARMTRATDSVASLILVNKAAFPFVGGVSLEQNGTVLGRVATAVYTRRRLDIALGAPLIRGPFTLRFDGDYAGLPAATRRDLLLPDPPELELWFAPRP